eukprot:g15193.t1
MALFTQVIYLIMFTCLLLVLLVIWYRRGLQSPAEPHVAVIVLGDIGRSPRMQYHAVSLAKHGCEVSLVGYAGAQPTAEVLSHPRIHLRHIVPWEFPRSLPFTIKAALKVRLADEHCVRSQHQSLISFWCKIRRPFRP